MSDTRYAHTADRSDVSLKHTHTHTENVNQVVCQGPLKRKKPSSLQHKHTNTFVSSNVRLWCEDGVKQAVLPELLGVTPAVSVLDNVRQLRLKHGTVHSGLQEGCPFLLQGPLTSKIPL